MSNSLKKIEEAIKVCENYKKDLPAYYDAHWKTHHKLLIQVKEELEDVNTYR